MIVRIYSIIPIYLQLSKTEGLTEMHWLIGQSVLEKFNSILYASREYHLCFQEQGIIHKIRNKVQMFLLLKS